ncbi:MAG: hypothetical protein O2809_11085 [Proteobacteria bacterium]|nr:hypothetical protein [Pseudomonadota bacterium]
MIRCYCRFILICFIGMLSLSLALATPLPVGTTIINAKFINIYNDMYSLVITRNTTNQIKAWLFDNVGNQVSFEYGFGTIANVNSAYILPIDANANQNVTKALLFLSTSLGLERIIDVSLDNEPKITANTNVLINTTPSQLLTYTPQILYRDEDTYFLILSYQSSIDMYIYTYNPTFPAIPSLTLSRTVSFSGETVKQVIPMKGFVIVVTENDGSPPNGFAHFIALAVNEEFATINLTSTDEVYLTYDPATQKTLLKTATDSTGVEIQNAPMPYGVIGMQSIQ